MNGPPLLSLGTNRSVPGKEEELCPCIRIMQQDLPPDPYFHIRVSRQVNGIIRSNTMVTVIVRSHRSIVMVITYVTPT